MCVNNLPKVYSTQWNSGATRDSNPGPRAWIPSALTTRPLSHTSEKTTLHYVAVSTCLQNSTVSWHNCSFILVKIVYTASNKLQFRTMNKTQRFLLLSFLVHSPTAHSDALLLPSGTLWTLDTLCCSSLALFKRSLKTFLFRQTFRPSSSCIARL